MVPPRKDGRRSVLRRLDMSSNPPQGGENAAATGVRKVNDGVRANPPPTNSFKFYAIDTAAGKPDERAVARMRRRSGGVFRKVCKVCKVCKVRKVRVLGALAAFSEAVAHDTKRKP